MDVFLATLKTKTGWAALLLAATPLLTHLGVEPETQKTIQWVLMGAAGFFLRMGIIKETS